MWHHLCNRFNSVTLRVLHPGISPHQTVPILRGLPEGSRLSPTLFGLFAADLVNHLKRMPQSSTRVSTCGSVVFYMSMTYAYSPPAQMNSNACYMPNVERKARMQINAQKSKVMAFHETPAQKRKRKEQNKQTRSASRLTPHPSTSWQASPPTVSAPTFLRRFRNLITWACD
jgi:hypothetical protein